VADLEALSVKIEADNAELKSALLEAGKVTAASAAKMEDAIKKFADSASNETKTFDRVMAVFAGTTLANLAVKAASLASDAFMFMIDGMKEGIVEAAEFDKQMTMLANSMKINGTFTEEASVSLGKFVEKMENLSGVDDEVIASNMALLSSLTGLSEKGLKRATEAAINLSAGLGIDLHAATMLIGKAAEGNVSAFKRYGLAITETADKTKTFENALSTVEGKFRDAAKGSMQTASGAWLGMSNAVGNLFQELGAIISRNPAVAKGLQDITTVIKSMTDGVKENSFEWTKGFAFAVGQVITITGFAIEQFELCVRDLVRLGGTLKGMVTTWGDYTNETAKAAHATMESDDIIKKMAGSLEGDLGKQLSNSHGEMDLLGIKTSTVAQRMATFGESIKLVGDGLSKSFADAKPNIDSATGSMKTLSEIEKMRAENAKAFADGIIKNSADINSAYTLQQDTLESVYAQDIVSFEAYKSGKMTSQQLMFDQELAMIQSQISNKELLAAAESQLGLEQNVKRLKLMEDLAKKEEEINKRKLQGYSTFFGNMATLQQSGSREAFAIGKAAALAQATIDGYAAIQGAYKQGSIIGGPGLGAAFGAAAAVATAMNISKIAATQLAGGMDSVPGVGSRDNFPAILAPGERVVPSETNKDLTSFLSRMESQGQSAPTFNLNFYGPVWSNKAEAGAEIVEAINEAMARGMSLRILAT
jgi:hypothetical protein